MLRIDNSHSFIFIELQRSGASRSVKVGSCGTRVVAGRIVTESYGAAQQQHTFIVSNTYQLGFCYYFYLSHN
ncbi:hypothetical protein ACS0TY_025114 [Phlomoides rotata]